MAPRKAPRFSRVHERGREAQPALSPSPGKLLYLDAGSGVVRRQSLSGIELFSSCPASSDVPQDVYLRRVADVARWSEACKHHALRSSVALPVPCRDLVVGAATDACPYHLETAREDQLAFSRVSVNHDVAVRASHKQVAFTNSAFTRHRAPR